MPRGSPSWRWRCRASWASSMRALRTLVFERQASLIAGGLALASSPPSSRRSSASSSSSTSARSLQEDSPPRASAQWAGARAARLRSTAAARALMPRRDLRALLADDEPRRDARLDGRRRPRRGLGRRLVGPGRRRPGVLPASRRAGLAADGDARRRQSTADEARLAPVQPRPLRPRRRGALTRTGRPAPSSPCRAARSSPRTSGSRSSRAPRRGTAGPSSTGRRRWPRSCRCAGCCAATTTLRDGPVALAWRARLVGLRRWRAGSCRARGVGLAERHRSGTRPACAPRSRLTSTRSIDESPRRRGPDVPALRDRLVSPAACATVRRAMSTLDERGGTSGTAPRAT